MKCILDMVQILKITVSLSTLDTVSKILPNPAWPSQCIPEATCVQSSPPQICHSQQKGLISNSVACSDVAWLKNKSGILIPKASCSSFHWLVIKYFYLDQNLGATNKPSCMDWRQVACHNEYEQRCKYMK